MSINFYYDIITDDGPVPNGIINYKFNKDTWPYPYGQWPDSKDAMTEVIASFYYTMKKNNCEMTLYTGDIIGNPFSTVKDHVFYPFEVSYGMNINIPHKTLDHLRNGKMKVLILGQTLQGYNEVIRTRHVAEMFMRCQVPIENILIVTADVNNSYRELLQPYKSYGIDWWQIEAKLIINNNTEKYTNFFEPINKIMPVKDYDMETFNPELLYHTYSEFPEADNCLALHKSLELNDLHTHGTIIDKDDKLDYHTNSLFTILTPWAPDNHQIYTSEVNALFTNLSIWQLIVMGKPFIAIGCQQTMKYINKLGYFTFYDLINEKYDTYLDFDIRADLICHELTRIKNNKNSLETKNILKTMRKFGKINRAKFLERSHMPLFLNLFDEIRYG